MQKNSPSFKLEQARKWHDYINFSFADQNAAAKTLSFLFKMKIRVDDDTLSVMINMKRKKQSKKI